MEQPPIKVLLVEDDEVDREIVHRLLDPDYVVSDAATGGAALALLSEQPPDCVILDFRLPDIDGAQLLPTLVEQYIPVIILTSVENLETVVLALQQGAQDYLVKHHLTRTSLTHAINEAIHKIKLQQAVVEQQRQLAEQAQILEQKNRQISQLASALTLAEQQERRRIAHILHDDLQQLLYGIQMREHLLELDISLEANPAIWEQLDALNKLTTQAIRLARNLSSELSPPVLPEENLPGAFQWLALHMADMHGLELELAISDRCQLADANLRILLFHIVRELLFNVVKHAGVKQAHLVGEGDDAHVAVRVQDRGVGFAADWATAAGQHGSFGLESARRRLELLGGALEIASQPGAGAQVTVSLPKQWRPVVDRALA
jgi:signal transduction histidine kinase